MSQVGLAIPLSSQFLFTEQKKQFMSNKSQKDNKNKDPCLIPLERIHAKATAVLGSIKEVARIFRSNTATQYIDGITFEVFEKKSQNEIHQGILCNWDQCQGG